MMPKRQDDDSQDLHLSSSPGIILSIILFFLWWDFHAPDVLICPSDCNRTTSDMTRQFIWAKKKKDLNFQKSCAHLKHGHEIQQLCGGAWDHVAHAGLVFWEIFIQGGINDSAGMSVTYFNCRYLFYDDPCADTSTKLRTSAQILHKLTIVVSKWKLCRSFWWGVENSEIITQMGFFL